MVTINEKWNEFDERLGENFPEIVKRVIKTSFYCGANASIDVLNENTIMNDYVFVTKLISEISDEISDI